MGNSSEAGLKANVLVVEDDPASQKLIAMALKGMGCDVSIASNADEAVAIFVKDRFDLITLDCRLPGLDCAGVHKLMSQEFGVGSPVQDPVHRPLPPIVIITGYPKDRAVAQTEYGESVVAVLRKPVSVEELRRVVKVTLKGRSRRLRRCG